MMKIVVNERALQWFKEEVRLEAGDKVRFFTKIYGSSPVQEGYGLAFTIDNDSKDVAVQTVSDERTFYISESDLWFFDGHDLHVEYNETQDEVEYKYLKP